MRTIVHLSDLHFGRVDQALIVPLKLLVHQLAPDVVVVSGDLTQRARGEEFLAARAFLDSLPKPRLVVPGNHDIPLYNVAGRFFSPLVRYRRYITADLAPEYVDDEIAVLGINTARSLTFKDGRINRRQIEALRVRLAELGERTRIIVTHHPFDLPETFDKNDLVDRAPLAMSMFSECGVDLLLAGHLHASHAGNSSARYPLPGYAALVVQAGTATSTRGRGEANSFNAIHIGDGRIEVQRYSWSEAGHAFALATTESFTRQHDVWTSAAPGI